MIKEWKEHKLVKRVRRFMFLVKEDHVSAYAAQAAYFLMMSFIPFILFLTTLIRYTPLTYRIMREGIISIVPLSLQEFVLNIVAEVYTRSTAIVPLTAVLALWSAGKGLQAITNGLNCIYQVKETRNWLINRIYSVIYTFLFVVALIVSLLIMVLGRGIQNLLMKYIPFLGILLARILEARALLVFGVLFFVFLVLYKYMPNRKATFRSQVAGAFVTAVAWSLFSYFFSIYFEHASNFSNMYGSLAAVIMVMLWLYVCMNLVLYGAVANVYFEEE